MSSTLVTAGSSLIPAIYANILTTTQRFTHLTSTNRTPNPCEASEIEKAVAVAECHLSCLRDKLHKLAVIKQTSLPSSDLLDTLRDTQKLEDVLQYFIYQHKKALSVVRRVPPEIWAEIFGHLSCPIDPCYIKTDSAPWVLGHVCSKWQAITNTPALWANICVDASLYQPTKTRSMTRRRQRLQNILRKSKAAPRSLYFRSDEDITLETLAYVARHSFRKDTTFRSLVLDIPFSHFQYIRSKFTASSFSYLHDLTIDFPDYDSAGPSEKLEEFADATRLKTFSSLEGFHFPSQLVLPLERLEDFTIEKSMSGDALLSILARCPRLRSMSFGRILELPTSPTNVIRLENLQSACLGDVIIVNYLDLPSLTKLVVEHNRYATIPVENPIQNLHNFLRRSNCGQRLTSLTVHHVPMESHELVSVLALVPKLQKLYISVQEPTKEDETIMKGLFLSLETDKNAFRPAFLPCLEEIAFSFLTERIELTIVDHCLVRMLRSRFRRTSGTVLLKSFKLHMERPSWDLCDSDYKTLRDMIDTEFRNIEIGCPVYGVWLC